MVSCRANWYFKETLKASLIHKVEGKVDPIEGISGRFALIVDGMTFVQQIKVTDKRYGEFAIILSAGKMVSRIDVVFDEHRVV